MNSKEIYNKLKEHLETIGWSLRYYGCEHYVPVDHEGKESKFIFWDKSLDIRNSITDDCCESLRISLDGKNRISYLTNKEGVPNVVCCGDKRNFILFMNHNLEGVNKNE